MKCSWLYVTLFSVSLACISCSDNGGDKEQGTNTAIQSTAPAPTTATTLPSLAKEKIPDAAVKGLKGKVKVLSESLYSAEGGKKLSSKNVFKFDAKGNRTELANYSPDGKLVSNLKSAYDANGNIVSEEMIMGNGTVEVTSTIKTDAKGNRIEQHDVRPTQTTNLFNYKYFYRYNEKGQEIEKTGYLENGTFFLKHVSTYDANGNRTEWARLGPDNSVLGKIVSKYDDKNNLIQQTEYKGTSELKSDFTFTYEFDRKGNWTRQNKLVAGKMVEIKERQISYE